MNSLPVASLPSQDFACFVRHDGPEKYRCKGGYLEKSKVLDPSKELKSYKIQNGF